MTEQEREEKRRCDRVAAEIMGCGGCDDPMCREGHRHVSEVIAREREDARGKERKLKLQAEKEAEERMAAVLERKQVELDAALARLEGAR